MSRKSIQKTLMERDGITEEEAQELVEETQDELMEFIEKGDLESAFYCLDSLGLEPDYLEELI